jgi:hypothetical protein
MLVNPTVEDHIVYTHHYEHACYEIRFLQHRTHAFLLYAYHRHYFRSVACRCSYYCVSIEHCNRLEWLSPELSWTLTVIMSCDRPAMTLTRTSHGSGYLRLFTVEDRGRLQGSLCELEVGIATRYGLHGQGIESRWSNFFFPHEPWPTLWPTYPPVQWIPGHSWG